jgi:hypothetical protein
MTIADNAAQRQGAARDGLLARYPLTFYFLITYAFSWLVWVPLALSAMLTVSQLSKSFAGRALFDDVSLQVNRGDRIGLVGKCKS